MSVPRIPEPAQVVVSILTSQDQYIDILRSLLIGHLGPIEEERGPLEFEFTPYYDKELGQGIKRWIWSFFDLVDRSELVRIKCLTNQLEHSYANHGRRNFNLDPGLVTLGNFVLATGKNNAHRIYLDEGIFADLTLVFRSGTYKPLEWTYPDYADRQLIGILNSIRETYKCKLKKRPKPMAQ